MYMRVAWEGNDRYVIVVSKMVHGLYLPGADDILVIFVVKLIYRPYMHSV